MSNVYLEKRSLDGRRPLVLLSGGLDSTFLAFYLLQKTDIDILYVKAAQGIAKIEAEQYAREKVIKWLGRHAKYKIVNSYEVDVSAVPTTEDHSFAQPLSWIYAAMNECHGQRHYSVMISYVMGDQICQHIPYFHTAWDALNFISKHNKVDLEFPLRRMTKSMILEAMPIELVNLTWVCELPIKKRTRYKACGHCTACITSETEKFRFNLIKGMTHEEWSAREYSKEVLALLRPKAYKPISAREQKRLDKQFANAEVVVETEPREE